MVLAIECDGASYHSSESARDRDRLRQEQLERLGWTFHRIWSQDWFRDKPAEIERAKAAYEAAVEAADNGDDDGAEAGGVTRARPRVPLVDDESVPDRGPCPIRRGLGSIDSYSHFQLVGLINWIESDTLLRTREALLEEAIFELGFRRRGRKIVAALNAAIDSVRGPARTATPMADYRH